MKRVLCRDSANIVRSNLLGEKLTKSLLLEVAKRRFVFAPALFVRVILSVRMWYNIFNKKANDKMTVKERDIMPKGERKEYSKEFKLTAVHLMKSGLFKPQEIFKMLGGVDRQTVYRWVKEYEKDGEAAFDSKAVLPGSELTRIQKENEELRLENEILKKATAYFAKLNVKK